MSNFVAKVRWISPFKEYETIGFYETLDEISGKYKDWHNHKVKWIKVYNKSNWDNLNPVVVASMSFKGVKQ